MDTHFEYVYTTKLSLKFFILRYNNYVKYLSHLTREKEVIHVIAQARYEEINRQTERRTDKQVNFYIPQTLFVEV